MMTIKPEPPVRVLPLKLSTVEQFFCVDSQPRYPMAFVLQLDFTGVIERSSMERAFAVALERNPLLNALAKPAKGGRLCWGHPGDVKPWINWGTYDAPIVFPEGEYLDLARDVGIRAWVRCGTDRSRLIVQFHHASCDGIGSYRFLGDLLAAYGQLTCRGQRSPELDEIDLKSLRQRQQRLTDRASIKGYKGIVGRSLREGYDMFLRRVEPLASPSVKPAAEELCSFPGIASYAFDRDEHERIRQTTGEWGVTVNDLLLAVSFQTMAEWNGARRSWWPAGALRIMMPVDLRETADFAMPATNILGYTFLTRPRRQCTDAVAMVRGIRDETAIMKHERRALRFNDAVAAVLLTPRLMRQVLSMDRCLATAIVSNAGDPTRRFRASFPREGGKLVAGNLVLEDIIGVPPLRIGTRVTLSVLGYQRKLCLAMRCDPHRFALNDTRQVLELYVQNLRRAVQL